MKQEQCLFKICAFVAAEKIIVTFVGLFSHSLPCFSVLIICSVRRCGGITAVINLLLNNSPNVHYQHAIHYVAIHSKCNKIFPKSRIVFFPALFLCGPGQTPKCWWKSFNYFSFIYYFSVQTPQILFINK